MSVHLGDCLDVLRALPDASVDAVVTDPPYGLEFMGKEWDSFGRSKPYEPRTDDGYGNHGVLPGYGRGGTSEDRDRFKRKANTEYQAWTEQWAREALRVLKPGGHALVFGGTRTYHRLASGLEDAGFEIRDTIAWMYGSGFPKSLDVSKAIDARNGAERSVIGTKKAGIANPDDIDRHTVGGSKPIDVDVTTPSTLEASAWQGWGTALKPAYEPITLARKPLQGTVAANVLAHGTGALNVDGCRIDTRTEPQTQGAYNGDSEVNIVPGREGGKVYDLGRWPANVTLDPEAAQMLDQQTGELASGYLDRSTITAANRTYGAAPKARTGVYEPDVGGASRFYYVAKTSRAERNAGLEGFEPQFSPTMNNGIGGKEHDPETATPKRNVHPTVKPIALMRWLTRLVTPPGGVVLDPFTGSGTTGCACALEGFQFIGIEREPDYHAIAEARIAFWAEHGEQALEVVRQAEKAEQERAELAAAGQTSILDLLDP